MSELGRFYEVAAGKIHGAKAYVLRWQDTCLDAALNAMGTFSSPDRMSVKILVAETMAGWEGIHRITCEGEEVGIWLPNLVSEKVLENIFETSDLRLFLDALHGKMR